MSVSYPFFDRTGRPARITRHAWGLALWSQVETGGEVHHATWEYASIAYSGQTLGDWLAGLGCERNRAVRFVLPDGWIHNGVNLVDLRR